MYNEDKSPKILFTFKCWQAGSPTVVVQVVIRNTLGPNIHTGRELKYIIKRFFFSANTLAKEDDEIFPNKVAYGKSQPK